MVYQIAVIVIHMLLHLTHVKKQDKLVKQIEIPECIHNKKQKNWWVDGVVDKALKQTVYEEV